MINYFVCGLKYVLFKRKYPSAAFIRPLKTVGTFFSQYGQDLYIASLLISQFNKIKSRVVIDIGANHPQKFSNTFFFEKYLGCETIAVDPLREFEAQWLDLRERAKFYNFALGSEEGEVILNVPSKQDSMFSYLDTEDSRRLFKATFCERRSVKMTTLNHILESHNVFDILFMSIDVEGSELEVLRGIDFNRQKFQCVLIENNSDGYFGNENIRNYMTSKGYIYFARIGWGDDLFLHPSFFAMLQKSSE
jgi:FkbM family methyltransferase